jgi:hypothetical protein
LFRVHRVTLARHGRSARRRTRSGSRRPSGRSQCHLLRMRSANRPRAHASLTSDQNSSSGR